MLTGDGVFSLTVQLEEYLARMEDPTYMRTVRDKMTGREVVLTEQQMRLVQRLQSSHFPAEGYDQYEVWLPLPLYPSVTPPPLAAVSRFLQRREDGTSTQRHCQTKEQFHTFSLGGQDGVATRARHQNGLAETTHKT